MVAQTKIKTGEEEELEHQEGRMASAASGPRPSLMPTPAAVPSNLSLTMQIRITLEQAGFETLHLVTSRK